MAIDQPPRADPGERAVVEIRPNSEEEGIAETEG
jgi:hypothetical protein